MIGEVYGRWTVIGKAPSYQRQALVSCKCECGTVKAVRVYHLKSRQTKSCGCLRAEKNRVANLKHGESNKKNKEYNAWMNMKSRCYDPNNDDYHNYGGRGITVCEKWLQSYSTFLSDVGRATSPTHSIDRINTNGNYCPENCKWSTPLEQANNKRNNKKSKYENSRNN